MATSSRRTLSAALLLVAATAAPHAQAPANQAAIEAETLQHFQALVQQDTSSPPGNEIRAVEYLQKVLTAEGIPFQVFAKDPRKFGDLITVSTPLPSSSGGRTYPATYPITYTGVSETGVVRLTNTGNTQAPVWLRVDGPIPAGGWTVTHIGKKQALTFATSLALTSGEFVTVDMDRREVLAQGQAARAGYVTSRGWFSLDPGDNDIAFSAAAYSATAQLTVTTKPSWS